MSEDLSALLRMYERLEARVAELEAQMDAILADPEEGEIQFYMDGSPVKQ